jgi:hypothetical protein
MRSTFLLLVLVYFVVCDPPKPKHWVESGTIEMMMYSTRSPGELIIMNSDVKKQIVRGQTCRLPLSIELDDYEAGIVYRFGIDQRNESVDCYTSKPEYNLLSYDYFHEATYAGVTVIEGHIVYKWENVDFLGGKNSTYYNDAFTGDSVRMDSSTDGTQYVFKSISKQVPDASIFKIPPNLKKICKIAPKVFSKCLADRLPSILH